MQANDEWSLVGTSSRFDGKREPRVQRLTALTIK
jgi:hypothetical protein